MVKFYQFIWATKNTFASISIPHLAQIHSYCSVFKLGSNLRIIYQSPTLVFSSQVYLVKGVEEKPVIPKSNLGILALYYFKPEIFSSLKKTKLGKNNEYQLTDGIQQMINDGKKVLAIQLTKDDIEIDVGTVESYRDAQVTSYKEA